jgi:hypothetical protein
MGKQGTGPEKGPKMDGAFKRIQTKHLSQSSFSELDLGETMVAQKIARQVEHGFKAFSYLGFTQEGSGRILPTPKGRKEIIGSPKPLATIQEENKPAPVANGVTVKTPQQQKELSLIQQEIVKKTKMAGGIDDLLDLMPNSNQNVNLMELGLLQMDPSDKKPPSVISLQSEIDVDKINLPGKVPMVVDSLPYDNWIKRFATTD